MKMLRLYSKRCKTAFKNKKKRIRKHKADMFFKNKIKKNRYKKNKSKKRQSPFVDVMIFAEQSHLNDCFSRLFCGLGIEIFSPAKLGVASCVLVCTAGVCVCTLKAYTQAYTRVPCASHTKTHQSCILFFFFCFFLFPRSTSYLLFSKNG